MIVHLPEADPHYDCAARARGLRAVLAEREAELRELKGPCRVARCLLHQAHRGPCDLRERRTG